MTTQRARFVALAALTLMSVAAAGSSGASANGTTLLGKVRIEVKGKSVGPAQSMRGRFSISGAITDRGRFIDRGGPLTLRTLVGAKGTIWIKVGFVEPFPCQCNWRIVKGTRAYAGLRGRGQEGGRYTQTTANVTMTGTVWR